MSGWYFMVTEYLECYSCRKKVAGWSQDILDQLDPIHREKFPAVLTYRLVELFYSHDIVKLWFDFVLCLLFKGCLAIRSLFN